MGEGWLVLGFVVAVIASTITYALWRQHPELSIVSEVERERERPEADVVMSSELDWTVLPPRYLDMRLALLRVGTENRTAEPATPEPQKVRGLSDVQREMLDNLIAGKLRIEWTDTGRQLNQEYLGKFMCTSKETVGLEIKAARERWLDKVRAEQDAPVAQTA